MQCCYTLLARGPLLTIRKRRRKHASEREQVDCPHLPSRTSGKPMLNLMGHGVLPLGSGAALPGAAAAARNKCTAPLRNTPCAAHDGWASITAIHARSYPHVAATRQPYPWGRHAPQVAHMRNTRVKALPNHSERRT